MSVAVFQTSHIAAVGPLFFLPRVFHPRSPAGGLPVLDSGRVTPDVVTRERSYDPHWLCADDDGRDKVFRSILLHPVCADQVQNAPAAAACNTAT